MKRSNPQSPPTTSKNMPILELKHVMQGSTKDVGADDYKARAVRARVIQHMERVEYAHEW
jgi:hypothetical protein